MIFYKMYKINLKLKMTTFKDITYKKNDDETWIEWAKRVPDNDEDKLDYIENIIYEYCQWRGKTTARKITDVLLGSSIANLISLLENTELLDAKIEEAYRAFTPFCVATASL